jgi:hypothetical protein
MTRRGDSPKMLCINDHRNTAVDCLTLQNGTEVAHQPHETYSLQKVRSLGGAVHLHQHFVKAICLHRYEIPRQKNSKKNRPAQRAGLRLCQIIDFQINFSLEVELKLSTDGCIVIISIRTIHSVLCCPLGILTCPVVIHTNSPCFAVFITDVAV